MHSINSKNYWILEMLKKYYAISFLLISFVMNELMSKFIDVGNYPNYQRFGINQPTCGLRRIPTVYEISFNEKCYKNRYENKTVWRLIPYKPNYENSDEIGKRIFNGENVETGESPWTVYLKIYYSSYNFTPGYLNSRKYFVGCTGTLIALDWVMTAAHCFEMWFWPNVTSGWVFVNAGFNDRSGTQKEISTNQTVYIHPEYPSNKLRDIALIKLNYSFIQVDNSDRKYFINTVCLPERGQFNINYETAYSYGYGLKSKKDLPEYLQKYEVYLQPYADCEGFFCSERNIGEPRTCSGDSGGPLIQYLGRNNERAVLVGSLRGITFKGRALPCGTGMITNNWIVVPFVIGWIFDTIDKFNKDFNLTNIV